MKFKLRKLGDTVLKFKDEDGDKLRVTAPDNASEFYYLCVNDGPQVRMSQEKAMKLAKEILKRGGLW